MTLLREKPCLPCQGGVPPLGPEECHQLHRQLDSRWHLNSAVDRLFCSLGVASAPRDTLRLLRDFGELSENENHHPELRWSGGRLDIEIWTHKIHALVESDFILAAKMDDILAQQDILTTAFDHLHYEELSWDFSEMYRGWHVLSAHGVFVRRLSFENFVEPWRCVLELLEREGGTWEENLGIGLGFGHLEVRMDISCGKALVDKINMLTGDWSHL